MLRSAVLLLALVAAAPARAQATPETPGVAGAVAAFDAFVHLQRDGRWTDVVPLLEPRLVLEIEAAQDSLLAPYDAVLADSAAIAADPQFQQEWGENAWVPFRRLRLERAATAEAFPPGPRADAATLIRRLLAMPGRSAPSTSSSSAGQSEPPIVVGSVAEGDALMHLVVRSEWYGYPDPRIRLQTVTMRWTGDHWTVAMDAFNSYEPFAAVWEYTDSWATSVRYAAQSQARDALRELIEAQRAGAP